MKKYSVKDFSGSFSEENRYKAIIILLCNYTDVV
jgi:hypothetical protein